MPTEKTTYFDWDKPVFPSDNLATELDTLFNQIDNTVNTITGFNGSELNWSVSNNGTEIISSPTDINFTNDIEVFDNGDETISISSTALSTSEKGAANGVAELDSSSKILSSQLPSLTASVFGRTGDVTAQLNDYTHNQIGGQSSDDHHTRYTDSEARSAVEVPVDSVNGQTGAVTVETPKQQIISLTTSSSQDVNKTTVINWDEHLVSGDSAFSHSTGNSSVLINETGTYKIYANIYTDSSSERTNPSFYFRINGNEVAGRSSSSYARRVFGHSHTSTNLEIVRELSPGDSIDIETFKEANIGTCNLLNRRSIFTIEKMIR